MTTPITYAPVHQVPARIAMQTPALAQLREAFARIPNEILLGLVNSILTGLGVPKAQIENTDNAILEVETALGNLFSQSGNSINNWAMLLSGLGLGNITSLTAWLTNIQTASTDAWNQISDFIKTGDWEDLSHAWDDLMKILFGSATQTGYSVQIPFTAVGNVTQDLQPVGDFPDKFSVSGGSDWTWDGTVDHTEKPGSGSAKAVLSGGPAELLGVLTPVQPGQIVDLECYVKWSGLSNGVIKVFLTPDKGDVFTLSVPSPGASGDWTKLSGSYTIPEGVSTVQVSLYCSGTGSVWFDDCTATVTGGWLADLENDLTEIKDSFAPNGTAAQFNEGINNIIALFGLTSVLGTVDVSGVWTLIVNDIVKPLNLLATSEEMVAVQADLTHLQDDANAASEAFATLLQSWWETLTASGLSFSEMWDQLEDAWQTYVETNADITNDEWATLTDIFDKLLGIDPTTGLFPQSKISDLPALQSGYSALKDEVNAGNQAFATLLNSWYETLTNSSLTFAQKWSELENEWESYVTANSDIVANEWATLTDIFNAILGIDPSTGLIPQDKITGLEASGDNWDAAYANVQNFLTEWQWSDLSAAWTDLNNALWGGSTGTVGSTIQLGAIPSEIPQSKIDGLEAAGQNWDAAYDNLHNFLVTWDWTDLSHAWTDLNTALWGGSSGTVGSTLQTSAVPNLPTSHITGLDAQLADLVADFSTAVTTGDWTDLLNDLFPSGDTSKTINANKIPNLPTSQITGLDAQLTDLANDFSTAVTTGDWTDLLNDLFGTGSVQSTVQQSAIPSGIPQSKVTGLPAIQSGLTALQTESNAASQNFADLLSGWQTTLTTSGQSFNDMWTALENDWKTYVENNADIQANQWATLSDIIGGLFGIDPTTGGIPQSKITGWSEQWNEFSAAISGDSAHAGQWGWLADIMSNWFGVSQSGLDTGQGAQHGVNGINDNQPLHITLDATADVVFPMTASHRAMLDNATSQTPDGKMRIGLIRVHRKSTKKSVSAVLWNGTATGQSFASDVRIGFGTMDALYSSISVKYISDNISSSVSTFTTPAWFVMAMPETDYFDVNPGDVLAPFIFFNDGWLGYIGMDSIFPTSGLTDWLPAQSALLVDTGVPTVGSNVSMSLLSSWSNIATPWLAVGGHTQTSLGGGTPPTGAPPDNPPPPPPANQYDPVHKIYTKSATRAISSWLVAGDKVDLVGLGAGGGGQGETGATQGRGGIGGNWNSKTLTVGTDIAPGGTITITVGKGGAGGAYFADGSDGTATVFSWKNPSGTTKTLTCAGGHGGGLAHGNENALTWGKAVDPASYSYQGYTYQGGGTQLNGQPGLYPGGGGSGGYAFQYGWAGANGEAWTTERQA